MDKQNGWYRCFTHNSVFFHQKDMRKQGKYFWVHIEKLGFCWWEIEKKWKKSAILGEYEKKAAGKKCLTWFNQQKWWIVQRKFCKIHEDSGINDLLRWTSMKYEPTQQPTNQPTNQPTHQPTNQPTHQPVWEMAAMTHLRWLEQPLKACFFQEIT